MTEACCINLLDYGGNLLETYGTLQEEDIGVDKCFCLPENIGTRAFDYITYIDKCGCCCRLDGEREIIVNTFGGELKNLNINTSSDGTCAIIKRGEIYGANWNKTIVRYKSDGYPISPEDGNLVVEEDNQNTYSSTGYTLCGLTEGCLYYFSVFSIDNSDNILGQLCCCIDTFTDKAYAYTGSAKSLTLQPGTYKLQVWGASGVYNASYSSGRGGGYSEGCITLTSPTCIYIYVGGAGNGQTGGWNGGGNGYSSYGRGGGGGTDMRIGGNSLYHRFIVAGGSGGNNSSLANCYAQGGAGGGACGMEGYYNVYYAQGCNRSGGGASQTSGGCAWNTGGSKGTFGQGGNSCSGYNAGGGGGGWYGGSGAYDNDSDNDGRGGGGGSGYTWTAATYSSHPCPSCLSGIPYLTNACCCAGNTSFPNQSGTGYITGNFGSGYAKISKIRN